MALSKSDLKAIKDLVDQSLDNRINPVEKRLDSVDSRISGFESNQISLIKDMKDIKNSVRKLEKNSKIIVDYFDRENIKISKKVDRIEKHLNLPQN